MNKYKEIEYKEILIHYNCKPYFKILYWKVSKTIIFTA